MEKILGTKMKMTQIVKDDRMHAVTPIKIDPKIELNEVKVGDLVKVSGTSKGRGFQGVVKRHGFGGGLKSHGQKDRLRAPGSIGSTAPQRVFPGKKMAGRMGGVRVTLKNLKIIEIDTEKKILFLKGATPGNTRGKIEIRK